MNHENWWKYPDEPFITNCSAFNAMICWSMWTFSRMFIFFFMYIFPFVLIQLFVKYRMGRPWGEYLKVVFCDYCGKCWHFIFVSYIGSIILGTSIDNLTSYSLRLAGVREEEFKSDEQIEREKLEEKMFLQRKKKGWANILFDEYRECPICLERFEDKDEVIQLNCSKAHIYHYDCI
jgi:hypothetical protein